MDDKADTIATVCRALASSRAADGVAAIRQNYPFVPVISAKRQYREPQALAVFKRDGFIDRYSDARLVFPGTLRLLSLEFPEEFPFHPNWKMSETHRAFWELTPTIDHLIPVAKGGVDSEHNWITTSMLRNSAKSGWTVEELGWQLHPPGDLDTWDGTLSWFIQYVEQHSKSLSTPLIRRWHNAAVGG
jgi:5-methylcytosine-specific restriction endonuclease McrA